MNKDINDSVAEAIETVDIHGKQHPTYAGVLDKAHKGGLVSIKTELIQAPLEENHFMAIVSARVTMDSKKVFTGIGDATPKNVNKMIAPHIVRMAETRAKGRALRDALNIAEVLKEEMGGDVTPENDVYERAMSGSNCPKCNAVMRKSSKGNWYCSDTCWKK